MMKTFVEWVVKKIVDQPDQVLVEEINQENQVLLNLKVAQEDMGRVIGKAGKIIKAIRNLVKIIAIKEGKLVNLQLVESESQTSPS